jgi:hypothetical protein
MLLLPFKVLLIILTLRSICATEEHCDSTGIDCTDSESDEGQFYRVKRAFVPYRTGKKVASQVSSTLDHLLLYTGYDKRIRPQVY